MTSTFSITPFGDHALLVSFKETNINRQNGYLKQLAEYIEQFLYSEISEIVYTYSSIAIYLKGTIKLQTFVEKLTKTVLNFSETSITQSKIIAHIPVCYELPYGLDLKELAITKNITIAEVIQLHSAPYYPICFIGFLPGFPYLNGLPKQLHTQRKETPRELVNKGAVGIGGNQTGIYPQDSPGGWNIIGQTPINLFESSFKTPALLKNFDFIKFESITKIAYDIIALQIKNKTYTFKTESKS